MARQPANTKFILHLSARVISYNIWLLLIIYWCLRAGTIKILEKKWPATEQLANFEHFRFLMLFFFFLFCNLYAFNTPIQFPLVYVDIVYIFYSKLKVKKSAYFCPTFTVSYFFFLYQFCWNRSKANIRLFISFRNENICIVLLFFFFKVSKIWYEKIKA